MVKADVKTEDGQSVLPINTPALELFQDCVVLVL